MLAEGAAKGGRMDAIEGRISTLQRIAFGADASDAERARAIAELAELAVQDADRNEAEPTGSAGDHDDRTEASDAPGSAHIGAAPRRRQLARWTVAAGMVGLLLGGALGWAAGQRVPADPASSTVGTSPPTEPPTPLEETGLLELFDRLPPAEEESTRVAAADEAIDPASVRLLATRVDGPAAYLARMEDGENVCFVLMLPAGPPRSECTVDGLLPADGLSILYGAVGYGLSAAELDPSGTVSLGLTVTF
jgi:hypothetical protein